MAAGGRRLAVVGGASVGFVDQMTPLLATGDHPIDGAPIGQATYVAVVDKQIGLQLACEVGIVVEGFLRVVAVDSIKLHAAFTTPLESRIQELTLTASPEDQTMTVGNEHLQRLSGEGALLADLRVFILNDRAVEINCNNHN